MTLVDYEIRDALDAGTIDIEPFDKEMVQPVSYDVKLSRHIRTPKAGVDLIDVRPTKGVPPDHTVKRTINSGGWTIHPRNFLLGCTEEYVRLSPGVVARVEGKSSIGRLGLIVHSTAGLIDPGFEGQITLEIVNHAPWAIKLYEGMTIAQLVFERVRIPEKDYSETGHYNGQRGPTESRYRFGG